MKQPPIGWTTSSKIKRCIDGDTTIVAIEKILNIRLIDCWTPETRTKDLKEKKRGLFCKKKLQQFLNNKQNVITYIPADQEGQIKDVFSLSRVLGRIFVNEQDISEIMVARGYAARTKKELMSDEFKYRLDNLIKLEEENKAKQ